MKQLTLLLWPMLVSTLALAQPATEIYLFDIAARRNRITIDHPINITNHKGYDNQPSFNPKESQVYYASFNEDGRSDIRMYDYKRGITRTITQTTEREYSPTVTPDQQHLSCIIQRDNNAQDLGKYPIEGGPASVIVDNLTVGYHVWADNSHVALFVLGTPNTLHYLRLPTQKDTVLAENIGRSLHHIPGEAAISFVHKVSEKEWLIKRLDTETLAITTLGTTLPGREDLCWLPDGRILMSDGNELFFLVPGEELWKKVSHPPTVILKGVTRLAVSANGKKLAVVVNEE
ncbi:MAG: hypothetical protein JNL40_11860 [Cyclobacteriaceae bacterium]|nr:hypothetical protein [Cyclobacteriaceae bacterium]